MGVSVLADASMMVANNTGPGITARVMRSSMFTILSFGVQQVIRFGSNLILARLLFPEAFGTMALVTVLLLSLIHI